MEVIRETRSVCPECGIELPARLEKHHDGVFLVRECPQHGLIKVSISRHADEYASLDRYYFSIMKRPLRQRDYIIRLTERCNLQCPICLASSGEFPAHPDLPLSRYRQFLEEESGRKLKIDLMSAEPTVREDLPEFIKEAKKHGHIVALHTNGIKISDLNYLKSLKEAGLDEVHLQLDGFSEKVNIALRGRKLMDIKMKTLENLEKTNTATDIVMVISPGLNEDQIRPMLDWFENKPFVRELFFLGLRSLGRARKKDHSECLMPSEVIDLVEDASGGLITREKVHRFQKLYFALLSFLGVRKCIYVQHYILLRTPEGYRDLSELFNWDRLEKHLEKLPKALEKGFFGRLGWGLGLIPIVINRKSLPYILDFARLHLRLRMGFDISRIPGRTLLLGFITACDPLIIDEMVANYCGKGELSTDVGFEQSGSRANVKREFLWKKERDSKREASPA
ncbi:MAG: radical SAM protein [Candidatus Eremiobacteraeota bacterium]|nr:radical SAM protein [Candidatus Eremiobacteraeota bacterium]